MPNEHEIYALEKFDERINHAMFLASEARKLKGKRGKFLRLCAIRTMQRALFESQQRTERVQQIA